MNTTKEHAAVFLDRCRSCRQLSGGECREDEYLNYPEGDQRRVTGMQAYTHDVMATAATEASGEEASRCNMTTCWCNHLHDLYQLRCPFYQRHPTGG